MMTTTHLAILVCLVGVSIAAPAPPDNDAIVFRDEEKRTDFNEIITPPVLPIIDHLENDPTTLTREDIEKRARKIGAVSPKFGITNSFHVEPSVGGGFSASLNNGFSELGGGNQASHSLSLGASPNKGFHVSPSLSNSASFGGNQFLGNSVTGSQSNSHSSSYSAGFQAQGVSSSSSVASSSSSSGNLFGQDFSTSGSHSQSSASSFGLQGISSAFGQGAGFASSFPGGQTFSNGQGFSNSFGNGAIGQASGVGFATNGNGFSGSNSNSQSSASANTGFGPIVSFGQSSGFAGSQSNSIPKEVIHINLDRKNPSSTFRFPGESTNRNTNVQYQTIPIFSQNKRKPDLYDIIRIEI
ncbi:uncharacterized protein LOC143911742 [Arctopsyche grandis]|uniref:uncharacterized protein LOC143911742 n=1 Tax=Arctopsyche grandis TaxID=121162 RepID=UPI00406D9DDC